MMIRLAVLVLCLTASGCADPHALTYTKDSDPIWALNPTMWTATSNELSQPPTLQAGVQPSLQRAPHP